jgi:hypothetical protein
MVAHILTLSSSLFAIYEYLLRHVGEDDAKRNQIEQSMEEISIRAITFAEAAYHDRAESYPFEIHSPYLPYSLTRAAIEQYRLWRQSGDVIHKRHISTLRSIIHEFTQRWKVACMSNDDLDTATLQLACAMAIFTNSAIGQYLDIIDNLHEDWPLTTVPFRGSFTSTARTAT